MSNHPDPPPNAPATSAAGSRPAAGRRARASEPEPRRWGRYAFAALVVALLVNMLAGERGYFEYRQLRQRRTEAAAQLESRRAENAALRQRIRELKSDPVAIEREIRGQMGYVKPGEVVFSVRDVPAPAATKGVKPGDGRPRDGRPRD